LSLTKSATINVTKLSKVHFFEVICFDFLLTYQPTKIPESDEGHFCVKVETDSEFNLFTDGNAVYTEAQIIKRDPTLGVNSSLESVTEDIV
jgi:hypothetical protein